MGHGPFAAVPEGPAGLRSFVPFDLGRHQFWWRCWRLTVGIEHELRPAFLAATKRTLLAPFALGYLRPDRHAN